MHLLASGFARTASKVETGDHRVAYECIPLLIFIVRLNPLNRVTEDILDEM
jgi:hypothetical protein